MPGYTASCAIGLIIGLLTPAICGAEGTATMTREGPLARVTRELYMPYPKVSESYVINNFYLGPTGLERYQVRTRQVHDDVYQDAEIRFSRDNGRAWTDWRHDPDRDIRVRGDYAREPYLFTPTFDPAAGRMVRLTLLRTHKGDPRIAGYKELWDHTVYQTSTDGGHVWDTPRLLKYEPGGDYSATDWGNVEYLTHNRSYTGYNVLPLRDGRIATACSVTVPITNAKRETENVGGVRLFVGKWNRGRADYDWISSATVGVPKEVSDRGLMEAWIAQLRSGDLFLVMRGNATKINPGRHFYAISTDGGKTLSEARELAYDDGSQFYAPSSLSMMFRHSVTGKLYWFGNISDKPSDGNYPRHPLYLAEVDEHKPALKRDTLTIIDAWDPKTQTQWVQFSNFSLMEDRETHAYEMYMTLWGEYTDTYQANVCQYLIDLK